MLRSIVFRETHVAYGGMGKICPRFLETVSPLNLPPKDVICFSTPKRVRSMKSKAGRHKLMKKTRKSCCIQFTIVGFFALLLAFSSALSVQADPLLKIADNVVRDTVFDLPENGKKPQDSRYNLWMYQNFLLLEGMDALGEVTGNETYKTYSDRNIDFLRPSKASLGTP